MEVESEGSVRTGSYRRNEDEEKHMSWESIVAEWKVQFVEAAKVPADQL